MSQAVRINLHCHSTCSDGSMPPQQVAEALASAGVRTAALTDHDTTAGLQRFEQELVARGVGFITGVEITVEPAEEGLHILAYGFDPHNPQLQDILAAHRRRRKERHGELGQSLLGLGQRLLELVGRRPADRLQRALPDAQQVVRAIHRAGGTAFLAHPLDFCPDPARLEQWVIQLKNAGLDGIEAIYSAYSPQACEHLLDLARRHDLLICAGSDFHGFENPLSVQCPAELWTAFCQANRLLGVAGAPGTPPTASPGPIRRRIVHPAAAWAPPRRFLPRIVWPTLLAVGLFVLAIFAVIVPLFENSLMDRKREMIRELTNSAWSVLAECHDEAATGRATIAQAQERARRRVSLLRYGQEQKDYFWIIDMHPRMVMHPYRADLDGTDLSDFADVHGRKLFVESVRLARQSGQGFVEYYWQWKDNPSRVVPKQSFVRLFEPWNWVIGTGIYLDDVHAQISQLTRRLVAWCLAIAVVVAALLAFMARESFRIERRRAQAERDLHESHEKCAALVEASTEGTLMVLDGRCAYANRTMCQMLSITEGELAALQVDEIFAAEDRAAIQSRIDTLVQGGPEPAPFETRLVARDGVAVEVVVALSRVALAGKSGFILVARDVRRPLLLASGRGGGGDDAVIEELRTSLLFLNEPLRHYIGPMPQCDGKTPILRAAQLMSQAGSGALAVTLGEGGPVVGVLTDQDLRQRVLLMGLPTSAPVAQVMSSPVIALPETAPVYEALVTMRQRRINHLGVTDPQGRVVGLVRDADIIQFHQYSSSVITGSIQSAAHVGQVIEARQRLPRLVQALLDSGARPLTINHITTRLGDAIVQRLIDLAIAQLGPPPVGFCWLTLGSGGRGEQTLLTDQDSGLVYEDPPTDSAEPHHRYFLGLAEKVCTWLDEVGYCYCPGQAMAKNPRWCQPLATWKKEFGGWITASEPQDLLDFSVFFDFRGVYGQQSLASELRQWIQEALNQSPPFFLHLARSALEHKPPVSLFGRILTGSGDGGGALNLKDAMLPIVNFARLYALKHGLELTNTLDRILRLGEVRAIREDLAGDVTQAYSLLMQLRLAHQARALAQGRAPDNLLDPQTLTHLDRSMLKQALVLVGTVQKKISYDFLGMA